MMLKEDEDFPADIFTGNVSSTIKCSCKERFCLGAWWSEQTVRNGTWEQEKTKHSTWERGNWKRGGTEDTEVNENSVLNQFALFIASWGCTASNGSLKMMNSQEFGIQ